jgi:DNA-binding NarL/FixJ family response regulator
VTSILVGVDAPVVRAGLETTLASQPRLQVVGWAAAPLELVELVAPHRPQVVLSWFDSLRTSIDVARAVPDLPVLAVAQVRREEDLLDALTGGVRGLLERTCTADRLVAAVEEVALGQLSYPSGWERALIARLERMQGPTPRGGQEALALTPRETDVLNLLLEGYSVKQVASRLGIALQTTKNHIHHVMVKTGSTSRVELVKWAMRHGFRPSLPQEGEGADVGSDNRVEAAHARADAPRQG